MSVSSFSSPQYFIIAHMTTLHKNILLDQVTAAGKMAGLRSSSP